MSRGLKSAFKVRVIYLHETGTLPEAFDLFKVIKQQLGTVATYVISLTSVLSDRVEREPEIFFTVSVLVIYDPVFSDQQMSRGCIAHPRPDCGCGSLK